MKKLKSEKNIIPIILIVFCLLVILCNSAYYVSKKSGFFLDETCTFLFANSDILKLKDIPDILNDKPVDFVINRKDTWISQDEIPDVFSTVNTGKFNYLDIYMWQLTDVHPPLYGAVINTFSSLLPMLDIKWIGFIVNTVFLLSTCILIYRICLLLLGQKNVIAALAAVLYYGLSLEYVNTATFYRMYAMLAFWFILLLYATLRWADDGYAYTKKHIICQCSIVFCAMLTQYFAVFYIFTLFLLNLIFMRRQKINVARYLKYLIITGVLYLAIWPESISQVLFTNRGQDVQSNLADPMVFSRIKSYIHTLLFSLFSGIKIYMMLFLIIAMGWLVYTVVKYVHNHKKTTCMDNSTEMRSLIYLILPAVVYYAIISVIAPWVVDRYQTPVMPLFSMIIIVILFKMSSLVIKQPRICGSLLIALALFLCFQWKNNLTPYYLYNDPQRQEFIANNQGFNAMIIDPEGVDYISDVVLNFPHPFYCMVEYGSDTEAKVADALDQYGNLVIYLSRECDEDLITNLQDKGILCEKQECSSEEFYSIYQCRIGAR